MLFLGVEAKNVFPKKSNPSRYPTRVEKKRNESNVETSATTISSFSLRTETAAIHIARKKKNADKTANNEL